MGTNLFLEGFPSPVVLSVTLPRQPRAFRDIAQIASALGNIDATLRKTWVETWPSYERRRRRDVRVLRFRVDSPSFFEILADPAWLAVFLVVVTGYKQGKESISEMLSDSSRLIKGVKGLTDRQLQLLEIAVRLTLERWLQAGEQGSIKMAKRFRRLRNRLTGDGDEGLTIEVKDVENKHRSW